MKKILCILTAVLLLLGFVSCGSNESYSGTSDGISVKSTSLADQSARKLIYTANISVETSNYDEYMQKVQEKVSAVGGYFSKVDDYKSGSYDFHNTSLVIRVPCDKYAQLKSDLQGGVTIISISEEVKDITLSYIDVQSHIDALTAEKDALNQMLASATDVTTMLTIQNELADVIYEIENYQRQLQTYDDQIAYSTINLYVDEVKTETNVITEGPFKKIGNNFIRSVKNVWLAIVSIFVFFVGYSPYFIVIGGIIFLVIFLVKKSDKRKKK